MNDYPTVAVVIPVFNGRLTIEACLESLFKQDYPSEKYEIVVVDNASTDGTPGLLKRYQDRITLLSEPTRGPSAARNRGVRETSAELIAFIDADCMADAQWLRLLLHPLETPDVGISGGKILSKRPCNAVEKFGEKIHDHQKAIEVYKPPYAISMNWASPRKVLLEAGLYDEAFIRCEDVDLSMRIRQLGYELVYQPDAITYHRNESNLFGLFREGFQHGLWAVRLIREHHAPIKGLGHRRFNLKSYKAIGANLVDAVFGKQREVAGCQAVFDIGKKTGKIAGTFRFRYIDL
jgi:GT2 family glycosyltransferase